MPLLAALPGPASAATPQDTLVIAWAIDDVITLDPAEAFEISAGEIMGNTYDRLVRLDLADPSRVVGDIAESWTVSEDGRTYAFTLRPGLVFASGNPLGAEEVAWSLRRTVLLDKSPAFILTQFGFTGDNAGQRIRATGPLTVEIETDRAYAPSFVLNCLTSNAAAIVDRQLLAGHEKDGDMGYGWLKTNYAGSGPMKLRDWRANEILVLERNERHHGEAAPLARVIYRHVKESTTQRLLLEKGDIDVARNLSPEDLQAVEADAAIELTSTPKGTVYYFSLNQKNGVLARPEVREAMKWLVDYDAIGATLIKGIGRIHQSFLPVGLLGAIEDRPYRLDVAKAKELLAKAGLADGFRVTMDVRSTQPVTGIAEVVQRSFAEAGITLEIIPGDGRQTLTKYRARNHDIYIGQWGADYWDPHTNADTFVRNPDNGDEAALKPLAWRNAWDIPELTAMADAAVLERDGARRAALYGDIQRKFMAESPFVMLFQQIEAAGVRRGVAGFRLGPTSDTTYVFRASKS